MSWYTKFSQSTTLLGFWVAPSGKMHSVTPNRSHLIVGDEIVTKVLKKTVKGYDAYNVLYERGYIRVYFHNFLTHLDCTKMPTANQITSLISFFSENREYLKDVTLIINGKTSVIENDNIDQLKQALQGKQITKEVSKYKQINDNPNYALPDELV